MDEDEVVLMEEAADEDEDEAVVRLAETSASTSRRARASEILAAIRTTPPSNSRASVRLGRPRPKRLKRSGMQSDRTMPGSDISGRVQMIRVPCSVCGNALTRSSRKETATALSSFQKILTMVNKAVSTSLR